MPGLQVAADAGNGGIGSQLLVQGPDALAIAFGILGSQGNAKDRELELVRMTGTTTATSNMEIEQRPCRRGATNKGSGLTGDPSRDGWYSTRCQGNG